MSAPTLQTDAGTRPPKARSRTVLALLLRNKVTLAGCIVLAVLVVAAVGGRLLAPYGINDVDMAQALQPPSAGHWFGTDELGRDVFSRVLVSARVSLLVGAVSVGFALTVGVTLGLLAGFYGRWLDTVVMRTVDVLFAFPVLLLALAIVAVVGPGLGTAMLAIGIVYTPIFARVTRASTLAVREEPFVRASVSIGAGSGLILRRHILPNITGPIIVQTSLSLAFAILSEAALSFLGVGIQPPDPSWGQMLYTAKDFMGDAWWLSVFPGAAIFVTVLAFNVVGDGLRDVLDPQHRSVVEARGK